MTRVNFLFPPFFSHFGACSPTALWEAIFSRGDEIFSSALLVMWNPLCQNCPCSLLLSPPHWGKIQLSVIFYFFFFFFFFVFSISPGEKTHMAPDRLHFLHLVSPPFMERAHPPLGDRSGGRDGGRRGAREGTPKECRHGGWRNARQADIRGTRRMELR